MATSGCATRLSRLVGTDSFLFDISLSEEFVAILKERGLDHEYVIVPGGPHSFALDHGETDLRPVVARFLKDHL